MYDMPKIKLNESLFTDFELKLAKRILNNGILRASKPALSFDVRPADDDHHCAYKVHNLADASAAYIWRNVAFNVSPHPQHHCLPVMADVYIHLPHDLRREWIKTLDVIVDKIVDSIPKHEWHGIAAWSGLL
jgi:hypothetical protein